MNHFERMMVAVAVISAAILTGCSIGAGTGEHQDSGSAAEVQEESGTELGLNESYDRVRNGARLIMAYDAQCNCFKGTVENTTDNPLNQVRVEVHLSNGVELGPTTPTELVPGESLEATLTAAGNSFDAWTAHPEVSSGGGVEHGGREGDGEHGGNGEHGREGESGHKEDSSD